MVLEAAAAKDTRNKDVNVIRINPEANQSARRDMIGLG
jgi:hypothetical protein